VLNQLDAESPCRILDGRALREHKYETVDGV
jgi:hypothetical protein